MSVLVFALGSQAFASSPDLTGTWTGTGTVVSMYGGVASLTITVTFTQEDTSTGWFYGEYSIDTSTQTSPTYITGTIASVSSLWKLDVIGNQPHNGALWISGTYTPAVLLVPASITLKSYNYFDDGELSTSFSLPCIVTVTLTKS